MKRNMMRRNLRRTIRASITRYAAIVAIIALGAGIFVGLLNTKADMVATGQKFTDSQNMFDLRLLNTYGWDRDVVEQVAAMDGVLEAEGAVSLDALASQGDTEEVAVYRLHAIPERINRVYLLGGRMPQRADECLVDGSRATDAILGKTFRISDANSDDTLESLNSRSYTIVGYVSTPIYMDETRGTTTLGNGNLASYVYLPADAFDVDYYTEINVTMQGDYALYSDALTDAMNALAESLEPEVTVLAQARYTRLLQDAKREYADGMRDYEQGEADYAQAKADSEQELADALQELNDGQAELDRNSAAMEDAKAQLQNAQTLLDTNAATIRLSRQELAEQKSQAYAQLAQAYSQLMAQYKTVSTALRQAEDGLSQMDSGLAQLNDGIAALESGLEQLDSGIAQMDTLLGILDTGIQAARSALDAAKESEILDAELIAQLEQQLQELVQQRDSYAEQRRKLEEDRTKYTQQLEELKQQRAQLEQQRSELAATKKTLDDAMAQLELGRLELQSNQAQVNNQFSSAEAKIASGQLELDAAQLELDGRRGELEEGLAELEAAKQELEDGWTSYRDGKETARRKLADARAELDDAKQQLSNARQAIQDMNDPDVYLLNRNTSAGYLALDSNSDIVAGVSRVFPAFFLLVAALVCITTMTRMVEEERTQIGTLKALGYTDQAIINKYLFYAGSAALLGCGCGVLVGSVVFPIILWNAYKLILCLTPGIVLRLNWPLCIIVVVVYTVLALLVTWYSCHRTLREVPAELIRPRAPTAGKKILLEYMPGWKRVRFLNKVMLRNIFRYRQRLAMMLLGIGGCTALLMTGFGLGDSIMGIARMQFSEVSVYDIQVQFVNPMTEQEQQRFREDLSEQVEHVEFLHMSQMGLDYANRTKDVYFIAANASLDEVLSLHSGETTLSLPDTDEALVSVGVAEDLGIHIGDQITLRSSDMRTLTLTVAGIFDNHVYNYVLVTPQTLQSQWGEGPEYQSAFVKVREGTDVHAAGAVIGAKGAVMNVTINADLESQVDIMLQALNMVVATVVICAGLLAVIVLYNLTNINITERIREIATIKVLGFRSGESAAYVFKENLLLTGIGTLLGLGAGKLLLNFVISQIKVDMVWFEPRVTVLSMLWSVLLTLLSACAVDFALYFKLEKINMAEALKSVE